MDDEGSEVKLSLTGTFPVGSTASYNVAGLPDGLKINGATGEITGRVAYRNATGDEPIKNFDIKVTLTAEGISVSRSFVWTIHHIPTPQLVVKVLNDHSVVSGNIAVETARSETLIIEMEVIDEATDGEPVVHHFFYSLLSDPGLTNPGLPPTLSLTTFEENGRSMWIISGLPADSMSSGDGYNIQIVFADPINTSRAATANVNWMIKDDVIE